MKKELKYILIILAISLSFIYDKSIIFMLSESRTGQLTVFYTLLTYIGSLASISLVALLFYLWVEHKDEYIMPLVYSAITTFIVVYVLKEIVMRPRPYELLTVAALVKHYTSSSFPSMHAAMAFVMVPVLNRITKLKGFWFIVAGLIAFSRVYLGVHFLSDIIVGSIIGYYFSKLFVESRNKKWFWGLHPKKK